MSLLAARISGRAIFHCKLKIDKSIFDRDRIEALSDLEMYLHEGINRVTDRGQTAGIERQFTGMWKHCNIKSNKKKG